MINQAIQLAPAVFILALCAIVFVEKTHKLFTGQDLGFKEAMLSFLAGFGFLGAKFVAGILFWTTVGMWVYSHRVFTLNMGLPVVWLGVFLGRDFVYYWVHRMEHTVKFFWASHMIHHSSPEFSPSTAVRVPWHEAIYKPLFSLWMPLLGFNPLYAILFDVFAATLSVAQHTQMKARHGIVSKVFVTPSAHRVHHGTNKPYLDKNFGAVLIVWDRMFGTYTKEEETVIYGVLHGEVNHPRDLVTGLYHEMLPTRSTKAIVDA